MEYKIGDKVIVTILGSAEGSLTNLNEPGIILQSNTGTSSCLVRLLNPYHPFLKLVKEKNNDSNWHVKKSNMRPFSKIAYNE